jgi:hypothetical protein
VLRSNYNNGGTLVVSYLSDSIFIVIYVILSNIYLLKSPLSSGSTLFPRLDIEPWRSPLPYEGALAFSFSIGDISKGNLAGSPRGKTEFTTLLCRPKQVDKLHCSDRSPSLRESKRAEWRDTNMFFECQ